MIINHNMTAQNSYRNTTDTERRVSKEVEKLSSGLRINRAGDDAAGLAISEKMRGQVKGLNMARKNSQDAISMIQTAEGALNESHSILQRMRELTVQSANDTNTDSDRKQIQKEMDRLRQELDRISGNTEFNTKKLLTGKYAENGLKFQVGANENQTVELTFSDMSAKALGVAGVNDVEISTEVTVKKPEKTQKDDSLLNLKGDVNGETHNLKVDKNLNVDYSKHKSKKTDMKLKLNADVEDDRHTLTVDKDLNVKYSKSDRYKKTDNKETTVVKKNISYTNDTAIDITSSKKSERAITIVNNAIEKVSAERAKYGAMQNRLEHTIKNLNVSSENIQTAESRIRDADMAKEMVDLSKDKIISRSGNAMLSQANSSPQSVLKLLR